MQIKSIAKEVQKLGGTVIEQTETRLTAIVNNNDVEFHGGVLTVRAISKCGTYDMGSDYNPGNYIFLNKIKQIAIFTN